MTFSEEILLVDFLVTRQNYDRFCLEEFIKNHNSKLETESETYYKHERHFNFLPYIILFS